MLLDFFHFMATAVNNLTYSGDYTTCHKHMDLEKLHLLKGSQRVITLDSHSVLRQKKSCQVVKCVKSISNCKEMANIKTKQIGDSIESQLRDKTCRNPDILFYKSFSLLTLDVLRWITFIHQNVVIKMLQLLSQ